MEPPVIYTVLVTSGILVARAVSALAEDLGAGIFAGLAACCITFAATGYVLVRRKGPEPGFRLGIVTWTAIGAVFALFAFWTATASPL